MSNKLQGLVWDGCAAAGLKLTEVAVMSRLADWCNDDGVCWPGVDKIARQLGAGKSTVNGALSKLEKAGWFTRRARRKGNRNNSNIYQLNVQKLIEAAAAAHPPKSDRSESGRSNRYDIPEFDYPESDQSESERSNSDRTGSSEKARFDRPESGGDPSVRSKRDPQEKTYCPVSAKPDDAKPVFSPKSQAVPFDPEVAITDSAIEVLKYFNRITASRYQVCSSSLDDIRARLRDGFTVEELQGVVDYLYAKWANDPDQVEYLRPLTLFDAKKFQGYLNAASLWAERGRPVRIGQKWVNAAGEPIDGDNSLRDAAYRRFIGSGLPLRNPGALEVAARTAAGKAGLKNAQPSIAVTRWNAIWKELSARAGGEEAA